MNTSIRRGTLLCSMAVAVIFPVPGQDVPERIILNLTETPAASMAVTWRTALNYLDASAEISESTPGPTNAALSRKFAATSTSLELPGGKRWVQSAVILDGLKPNTRYAYRVGHDSVWSEWNQFGTARGSSAPFTFVYLGDPQSDIRKHVSRVFREAYREAGHASFWLFTGDLTTEPEDGLWQEWFDAAGFIPRMVPMIMAPGNHDHGSALVDGKKVRTERLPLWHPQFTLPENGVPGMEELSYYVDYQGVRILMLNSNNRLKEQAEWLDTLLSANPNRWTIAAFHHPLYSSGRNRDDRSTRDAFQAVFERHGVDLVLQGHDHSYARSRKLMGGRAVGNEEKGIVYVVSSCGPKTYPLQMLYRDLMAAMGEGQQLFQVITVEGNTLQFKAVTAGGTTFDSFELKK